MKKRLGFVSNSSSSSFIIAVPSGTTEEQIRAMIAARIGILNTCLLGNLREDIINTIMECKDKYQEGKVDLAEELKEQKRCLEKGYTDQKSVDFWQDKIDRNFDVYRGGFSDNGEGHIQYLLCYSKLRIDEKDFFMENYDRG